MKAKDDGFRERIEDLKEQLRVKDNSYHDRIEDLKEQLRVKDSQLESGDSQLEKQAVHIQTLISQKASRRHLELRNPGGNFGIRLINLCNYKLDN